MTSKNVHQVVGRWGPKAFEEGIACEWLKGFNNDQDNIGESAVRQVLRHLTCPMDASLVYAAAGLIERLAVPHLWEALVPALSIKLITDMAIERLDGVLAYEPWLKTFGEMRPKVIEEIKNLQIKLKGFQPPAPDEE